MTQGKPKGEDCFARPLIRLGVGALLLWLFSGATVAQVVAGGTFPELSLPDQHGEVVAIGNETEVILFAADRPASDLLNGFLRNQVDDFLLRRKAAYIADISTMPGLITRMVALPRMRERPYRILLVEDAERAAFLPRREGAVTVIRLAERQIATVDYAVDTASLTDLLRDAKP